METAAPSLPTLSLQLDRILEELESKKRIGLLYVTVLRRKGLDPTGGWPSYDAMLRTTHELVRDFHRRGLRRSDTLLEPVANGNAFVLLIDAPRGGGVLDRADVAGVRARLQRHLARQLSQEIAREAHERFGCYVGGTVLRYEPEVSAERLVYRALEEAFVDALRAQERESRRQAVHLRYILRSGRVRAVYQPVVDIQARGIVGYEALTRVPSERFESPDLLFRAAHENDVLWNLERLCRRKALDDAPRLEADQLLFLNTEPNSVHDPQLRAAAFRGDLEQAGLHPNQVVLELTEHNAVRDPVEFQQRLREFRAHGFRLAIDDVGSGFSGLQAIAEIAPEFIKIDMTLVRDSDSNPLKRELIDTICRFSDRTGIVMVAEGVETLGELQVLATAGVRCAQGFLFARPDAPPGRPDWDSLVAAL